MDRKYVIAIAVCVTVIVVIIIIVVVVVALLIRRRRRVVHNDHDHRAHFSVESTVQLRAAKNYRISRNDIVERSGKDDLELKGVTNSPTGEAITAMCPPTPPVGGAAHPRLDPI